MLLMLVDVTVNLHDAADTNVKRILRALGFPIAKFCRNVRTLSRERNTFLECLTSECCSVHLRNAHTER